MAGRGVEALLRADDPAIHVLRCDRIEQVGPIWIASGNHSDLPRSRPMLDVVFALDGTSDVVKPLEVNKLLHPIPFGKALDESRSMFENPTDEIVCHANVKNAVRTTCQNVNITAVCHVEILQDVDGRDIGAKQSFVASPGHDDASRG
jgi:hypothetical protein